MAVVVEPHALIEPFIPQGHGLVHHCQVADVGLLSKIGAKVKARLNWVHIIDLLGGLQKERNATASLAVELQDFCMGFYQVRGGLGVVMPEDRLGLCGDEIEAIQQLLCHLLQPFAWTLQLRLCESKAF